MADNRIRLQKFLSECGVASRRKSEELIESGAVKVNGKTAVIEGVKQLMGCAVRSTDLRAGAAMLIAGLIAKGTTELYNLTHIDRGYENFESKLRMLGADITRINDVEDVVPC